MKKRLFVAAPISDELKGALGKYIAQIKADNEREELGARWAVVQNLHITVCFLGSVEEKYLPGIEATLRQIVQNSQPLMLRFVGVQLTPLQRPRMIWAMFAKNSEFNVLVTRIAKALESFFKKAAGRRVDLLPEREIVPHVTLARFKGAFESRLPPPPVSSMVHFKVSRLELFASQTLPSRSVYTQLGSYQFTGN